MGRKVDNSRPRFGPPALDQAIAALALGQYGVVSRAQPDSWRYHKTRRAFEDDRARDVLTTSAGYRTLRFTDRQLTRQPHHVAQAIAAVLADRRAA